MNFKRVRNMFLVTALTCSMVAVPVFAAPNTSNLEDKKKAAQGEVNSLQSQLTDLMSKMTDLQNQLITKGEEVTKAESKLKDAQKKEKQQYGDMKLRIKYMYEEGDDSAVERILQSGSIAEMLSQAEYVQKVHTYDRNMLNTYVDTVNEVKDLKTSLEKDVNKLENMQTQYESQKTELNTTLQSKSAEVANLDEQIQEAARKAAEEQAAKEKAAKEKAEKEKAAQNNNTGGTVNPPANNIINDGGTTNPPPQTPSAPAPAPAPAPQPTPDAGSGSPGNLSAAQTIVNAAWSQIGVPYVWGGTTPYVGLDCSGLTQWCHAQAGISIGRVDTQQLAGGTPVSDPQPGDIAWTPGHVAIYIGNGQMIEAPDVGLTVRVSPVRATTFVRYW